MKLIIQSDDLGISEAVSCGIARAAREGAITCTGLFSNMPTAPFAVELMKQYSQICLGEDFNLVAGYPCADPASIPSLVQPDGMFLTSEMHREIDRRDGHQEHVKEEDCVTEMEAQIHRFQELTGKLPEYLHGHSYSTPAVWSAMETIGKRYDIPLVRDLLKEYEVTRLQKTWNQKPFSLEDQMAADPISCIVEDTEFLSGKIGFIGTHCGYVDSELFGVSTYTLIRNRDLQAVTSETMAQWIQKNNIELISYRDLLGLR